MYLFYRYIKQLSFFTCLFLLFPCLSTIAQLVPDDSLGKESSTVNPSMDGDLIEGGAIRSNNLFHSFKDFNVNAFQKVYFSNPDGITNIITRVRGSNASKIFGTLGVKGNANLFLINPKGIIFGENAILDVSGSFSATTAESIFIDNFEFSAVNPGESVLLKINLTPGLQYGKINSDGEILNQGVLKVGEGENLTLLGGRVNHSGSLIAPGGNVEVSGEDVNLQGFVDTRGLNGEVGTLLIDPKNIVIQPGGNFSGENISQALAVNNVILQANNNITVDDDITGIGTNNLTFEAGRSVIIGENRNIILNGGNFNAKINDENALPLERDAGIAEFKMNPGSSIITNGGEINVFSGSFADTSQIDTSNAAILSSKINGTSGNINLSAIGNITTGRLISGILNPDGDSSLNAGDISVNSINGDISTTDFILANSLVKGGNIQLRAANNLNLTAQEILRSGNIASVGGAFAGEINLESGNTIFAQNLRATNIILGNGIAEVLSVKAKSLILDSSSIIALSLGESKTGNLFINVEDEIILRQSTLATNAEGGSSGDAGDLTINTKRLTIQRIPGLPSPFGVGIGTRADPNTTGNAGDLTINASESLEIIGDRPGNFVPTPEALVNSLFQVVNGTGITTSAEGTGISGKLTINTPSLIVRDGAGIITTSFSGGEGDLTVNANEILLRGNAGIASGSFLAGDSGDLTINVEKLTLYGGANISAATNLQGNAGNLTISVEQLSIRDGSTITSGTTGGGKAANLTIKDAKLIEIIGSSAPGSITDENLIELIDTSEEGRFPSNINSSSIGNGNAGNIDITTDKLIIRQRGEISTATINGGAGGNIEIDTRILELNNGRINASTLTPQKGGDITINASESVEVIGGGFEKLQRNIINPTLNGENLTLKNFNTGIVTSSQAAGSSGSILIQTPNFSASNGGLVATTTLTQGKGGDITINAGDILKLDNSLLNTATFTNQDSGNVKLSARQFTAIGGAQVITNTFASGNAGNLTVNVSDSIDLIDPSLQGFTSGLFATSFQNASGDGGDITVNTGNFNIVDRAAVSVSGEGEGNAGDIDIDAVKLFLDNSSITATSVSGEGGDINISIADLLLLRNNSTISTRAGTETGGGGNGGNITINGGFIVAVPRENSDINANAFQGNGGNINIATPGLFGISFRDRLTDNSDITASSEFGIDGNFSLDLQAVNPNNGLIELPQNLTDAADRISAGCPSDDEARFVTSGRGGLPLNPQQVLHDELVLQDLRDSVNSYQLTVNSNQLSFNSNQLSVHSEKLRVDNKTIVEATGWIVNQDGVIEFVGNNRTREKTVSTKDSCRK